MNMSYCRFENTLNDLRDCLNALKSGELQELSETELAAAKQLVTVADDLVTDWADAIQAFDPATVPTCRNCGERSGRDIYINDEDLCEECEENTAEEPVRDCNPYGLTPEQCI